MYGCVHVCLVSYKSLYERHLVFKYIQMIFSFAKTAFTENLHLFVSWYNIVMHSKFKRKPKGGLIATENLGNGCNEHYISIKHTP